MCRVALGANSARSGVAAAVKAALSVAAALQVVTGIILPDDDPEEDKPRYDDLFLDGFRGAGEDRGGEGAAAVIQEVGSGEGGAGSEAALPSRTDTVLPWHRAATSSNAAASGRRGASIRARAQRWRRSAAALAGPPIPKAMRPEGQAGPAAVWPASREEGDGASRGDVEDFVVPGQGAGAVEDTAEDTAAREAHSQQAAAEDQARWQVEAKLRDLMALWAQIVAASLKVTTFCILWLMLNIWYDRKFACCGFGNCFRLSSSLPCCPCARRTPRLAQQQGGTS